MKIVKKRLIRYIFLFIAIACLVIYIISHIDLKQYTSNNIEEYVVSACKKNNVPSLSVAIIDNGQISYINYGEDKGIDINEKSLFELGSTTKAFTALGIIELEDKGLLNINDKVRDYLPWFTPTYQGTVQDITIKDLLTHRSGIPAWTISLIPEETDKDEDCLLKTVEMIKKVELHSAHGTKHEYATINYDILALILENITGEKYEDYISQNILRPLGMKSSYFRTNDNSQDVSVDGHRISFFVSHIQKTPTYYGNTAAGYLVSCSEDLTKWMQAQLLSNTTYRTNNEEYDYIVNLIRRSHEYYFKESDNYYAGWNDHIDYYSHSGNNPNFSSVVYISKKSDSGVFVLSSISGTAAVQIGENVFKLINGEMVVPGFIFEDNAIIDCIAIIVGLMTIYFASSWKNTVKRKRLSIIKIALAIVIALFPYYFHYNYYMFYIWYSPAIIISTGLLVGSLLYKGSKELICGNKEN